MDLLLVHWEQPTLPEDITIEEGLITVLGYRSSYVSSPIANASKQDITLNQHTVLGHLQTNKITCTIRTEQVHIDDRGKTTRHGIERQITNSVAKSSGR